MFQLKQDLTQPGDAGGRFQMPDIRLHGSYGTILFIFGILPKSLGESPDFNGISQFRAGAVGFHITDGSRVDAGFFQGLQDKRSLGPGIRYRITRGLSSVIDPACPDDAVDMVSVGNGGVKRFQQYGPHPLARYKPVSAQAERMAAAF